MREASQHRAARPMTTDAYPVEITPEDFMLLGAALVSAACGMTSLGHESPAGLTQYVDPDVMPTWHARFVLDMVAHSQDVAPSDRKNDALDRIYGFVWQSGAMHAAAVAASI